MKYIVAVSGGVDSVVLLDMMTASHSNQVIVAHFDHGIRPDSAADARFVAALAKRYDLRFELGEGKLGAAASEEQARSARYSFLREIAARTGGTIVTAHHQDDLIETIAINLSRGTGWRGLAGLNDPSIHRPLLDRSKQAIYSYALKHSLEWVEDETNHTQVYLRNRIRTQLGRLPHTSSQRLTDLWTKQCQLAGYIDKETIQLITDSRYFMAMVDEESASELLRSTLALHSVSLTRPQRRRLLHAIKTAKPGSTFEAGMGTRIDFTLDKFIVKHP